MPPNHEEEANEQPAQTDPLVGVQRTTDSAAEAEATPDREVTESETPAGQARKQRSTAATLGLFLGGLGVHRFYLGFHAIGAFQLVLFLAAFGGTLIVGAVSGAQDTSTLFLNALGYAMIVPIWGFIEGLCILFGALNRDAAGRPLA